MSDGVKNDILGLDGKFFTKPTARKLSETMLGILHHLGMNSA